MLIKRAYEGDKVPKVTRWLYPFSGIFRDACYALVGSFLLQYAISTGVLSSDETVYTQQYLAITIAMIVALIWDGIDDPIMGFIVERCHFKTGKFKPWILIGAIGNTVAVLCMFLIRPGSVVDGVWVANGWAYVGCMIAFYFLWDLFFTMNDIGYWAMLPSLSNDEEERNKLTSRVTIAASIGGFLGTIICVLLPTATKIAAGTMYGFIAIGISFFFLLSQTLVYFLCQEKVRDPLEEEKSDKATILDLFKVFGKNGEVRAAVIAIFLYYLGSAIMTGGIGLNYYYLMLGYGSGRGGLVATVISVMYVIAMIVAQGVYPAIAKKLPKKKILLISIIIQVIGYAGFFFTCVPLFGDHPIAYQAPDPDVAFTDIGANLGWAFGGLMFFNYLWPLIFFFADGLMYMALLVMLQDAIDYNEWKFGERKESIISSWRPLDVKLESALMRLIQYLVFLIAGAYEAVSAISAAEGQHNAWTASHLGSDEVDTEFIDAINAIEVSPSSIRIAGILIIVLITLSMIGAYLVARYAYKTDEQTHAKIAAELAERHEKARAEKAASAPQKE